MLSADSFHPPWLVAVMWQGRAAWFAEIDHDYFREKIKEENLQTDCKKNNEITKLRVSCMDEQGDRCSYYKLRVSVEQWSVSIWNKMMFLLFAGQLGGGSENIRRERFVRVLNIFNNSLGKIT